MIKKMINAGSVITISDADGMNLQEPQHLKLGKAVAVKVEDTMKD